MSLGWVIAGTFGQLMLAFMLFMVAAFAGGGLANGRDLGGFKLRLLDLGMIALPASAVFSAIVVIDEYRNGGNASAYYWYLFPFAATFGYFTMFSWIDNSQRK